MVPEVARPHDEPEGLLVSQAKMILGISLAIGLQLGAIQSFVFQAVWPLFSNALTGLVFGGVTLLIWQTIFPRLRRIPRGRRILVEFVIAIAVITPTSFAVSNGVAWLQGGITMFRPYGGQDIEVTIAASLLRAAPFALFLLPIVPIVLMVVIGFNQSWWQIFLLERRESRARAMAVAAELDALRAQINPHFLFNSLNSISQLISSEPQRAEACVERLAEIFRYLMHSDSRTFVTLGDELGIADAYLDIERARFGERLTVDFLVDEKIRGYRVPSLILQPLIENAVRHGISPKIGGGRVSIEAELVEGELKLVVRDTGVGMRTHPEQSLEEGVGLRNVYDRLIFLFGEDYAPRIDTRPGEGTSIELRVPPESKEQQGHGAVH